MKVEIFSSEDTKHLQDCINEFIKENDVHVIDIKYSTSQSLDEIANLDFTFSALIMYK